jgi:hypothetical protein
MELEGYLDMTGMHRYSIGPKNPRTGTTFVLHKKRLTTKT